MRDLPSQDITQQNNVFSKEETWIQITIGCLKKNVEKSPKFQKQEQKGTK